MHHVGSTRPAQTKGCSLANEGNQAPGTKINNTGDNGETIVLGEHDWVETEGTILIFRLRRWKQTRTKGL
jgi:hypothetical protein